MFESAYLYVTRKRERTLIMFILLVVITTSIFISLTLLNRSLNAEKNLKKVANSTINLQRKDRQKIKVDDIKDLEKIKDIKKIIYTDIAYGKSPIKVINKKQLIQRDDLPDNFKNLLYLESTTDTMNNLLFKSGVYTLLSGRTIKKEDHNKILIHEELAKLNNLKIHDKIKIEILEKSSNTYEIVGIFKGKKEEKYTGLTSDFSENHVFLSGNNLKEITSIDILSNDAKKIEKELFKRKDINDYLVSSDRERLENSFNEIKKIKSIITIMTVSIIIVSLTILSLILILWMRGRLYEIGVLLALGSSKTFLILKFILELVMITIVSNILSIVVGTIILNNLFTKFMLLGNLNLLFIIISFIKSYLLLLIIIVVSVLISSIMILINKPKDILSKIS